MSILKLLIVDDEEPIRKLLKSRFEREGYQVITAFNPDEAITLCTTQNIQPAVVVSDLKMPGHDGFWLLAQVREKFPHARFILATGFGEKEVAVQALRDGAADYLEKPFDLDELSLAIKRCSEEVRLKNENSDLMERLQARVERAEKNPEKTDWIPSQSPAMNPVEKWLKTLQRESHASNADEPNVLVLGQSGTGKERVAVRIHNESRRAKGAFLAVNCANFTSEMLESELFGHEKGSFTGAVAQKRGLFELAHQGTLFLDEIGEMDLKLQPRLLRVLQEKTFRRLGGNIDIKTDVRVISATNRSLNEMVTSGKFREDLFHRINRVIIDLPSLCERREDILFLAETLGKRAYTGRHKKWPGFTQEAESMLLDYSWPGNLRELMNVMERAALLDEGNMGGKSGAIPGALLALQSHPKTDSVVIPMPEVERERENGMGFTDMKKKWSLAFEREYLSSLLDKHGGNISAAAREAQLDRSNMMKLLKKHGLSKEHFDLQKAS